jgi:hypothetical protein
MTPVRAACLLAAGLLACAPLRALEWENLTAEVGAFQGDSQASAVFRFRNTGHFPVTITSVDPSCGCTSADADKKVVAPGESDSIRATLDIGTRVGRQEKWITVTTDEVPAGSATLTLVVTIKETVTCAPRLLFWKKGGPAAEQATDVVAAEGETLEAVTAAPDTKAVSVRVEAVEPGRRFRIRVVPGSTDRPLVAEIPCSVRVKGRPSPPLTIYASIN